MRKLSKEEARAIILGSQGLADKNPFGLGLEASSLALEHLGYVQIDTISVVERAHHHVLWSRVSDYKPAFLNELVAKGMAFEYWSHAASFLPMKDYRFSLLRKARYASGEWHWFKPNAEHKKWRKRILERIHSEGPLAARDFEGPKKTGAKGWFNWKPAKQMLDQLFMEGQLMICERRGFEKIYDLTQRVLPSHVNQKMPSPKEYARYLISTALRAHGLVRVDEVSYLRRTARDTVKNEIHKMLGEGEVEEVSIAGIDRPYLRRKEELKWQEIKGVKILSPFDNQVIQRNRLRELFSFDYQIECYVPEKKRKFGYFCLPVLIDDQFAGRLDIKAFRKEKILEVRSEHWDKKKSRERAKTALKDFALFNQCEKIIWPR